MSMPPPPPPPIGMPGPWSAPDPQDTSRFDPEQPSEPVAPPLPQGDDDEELKATDPEPVKYRKRARASRRMQQLIDGEISVEDLDDEELRRGQLRDRNGHFSGRKALMVPAKFHDEMVRRILGMGQLKLRENFFAAIETISDIMKDTQVDPSVRLRAADMLMVRVAGKPVEKVELSVEVKPWQTMMQGIMKEIPADAGELMQMEGDADDDEG